MGLLFHSPKKKNSGQFFHKLFFLLILQPISQWHYGHTMLYDVLCKHKNNETKMKELYSI